MLLATLLIILSLVLLYWGADWLVRGGASLALRLGLTPVVVGLTVVAYGTSMPEMIVSTKAALAGQGPIAIGNVIGSNIFNITVILGLAALVCPVKVQFQLLKLDAPVMMGATLLFLWFFRDGRLNRSEAAIFFALVVIYTIANVGFARRAAPGAIKEEFGQGMPRSAKNTALDVGLIFGGLVVLIVGSQLLVDNAVLLARQFGVSEAVIGLTIVAAGTSMPELATSVIAALRRQPDIALGNVIGSNIFNVLGILGVSGMIAPLDGAGIQRLDLLMMLGTSVILLPLLWTGRQVSRLEGSILVALYGVYIFLLWPQ